MSALPTAKSGHPAPLHPRSVCCERSNKNPSVEAGADLHPLVIVVMICRPDNSSGLIIDCEMQERAMPQSCRILFEDAITATLYCKAHAGRVVI